MNVDLAIVVQSEAFVVSGPMTVYLRGRDAVPVILEGHYFAESALHGGWHVCAYPSLGSGRTALDRPPVVFDDGKPCFGGGELVVDVSGTEVASLAVMFADWKDLPLDEMSLSRWVWRTDEVAQMFPDAEEGEHEFPFAFVPSICASDTRARSVGDLLTLMDVPRRPALGTRHA
jgi:hypothetical protein